jgi:hypothetical protein
LQLFSEIAVILLVLKPFKLIAKLKLVVGGDVPSKE